MSLHNDLQWRYATKKMNGQPVPEDKVEYILEATRLAPTSSGLQPFRVLVVRNAGLLAQIKPIAFNQSQITDASHLLVFAAWDNITEQRIDDVFSNMFAQRGQPADTHSDYRNMLVKIVSSKTPQENFEAAARQAYIGLGLAIAAAAEQRVDATPMEGFDNAALDQLLHLPEKGLKSVALLPLGYRDEANDWLVKLKKVRVPKDEFVIELA